MTVRGGILALAIVAGTCPVSSGDITGKVTVDGNVPKRKQVDMSTSPDCVKMHHDPVLDESIVAGDKGELKNVAVYIKDGAKLNAAVPATPVVLDQTGCVYVPHVVTVMVGQTLQAKNSDGFVHNVHGLANANGEFNFPQTQGQTAPINGTKAAETYKVKCDMHGWMYAYVVVTDSPYSAVTKEDGTFAIDTKGLKDGKYTLVAWHEKLKPAQEAQIEVKDGKATADFKFAVKK